MDFKSFFSAENMTALGTNLAIIVFAFISFYKTFSKKFKELSKNDYGSISKKGEIKRQSETDIKITKRMGELKEILNADRVQIYDFHNGIHYANGRSAVKITCTYESCRYGVKQYQNQLAAIPISCLPNYISKLLEDEEFVCKDIETIKETCPSTYEFKKNMQIESFYDVVFHNDEGEVVGFIAIQFCNNKYNIDKEQVQKLVGYVESELSLLLDGNDEKEKSKFKKF